MPTLKCIRSLCGNRLDKKNILINTHFTYYDGMVHINKLNYASTLEKLKYIFNQLSLFT